MATLSSGDTWDVQSWLESEAIEHVETSAYWNDPRNESEKAWDVSDGDFEKMERHLIASGLIEQLSAALNTGREQGLSLRGIGADLGCGTCWAEPHLLQGTEVEKVYCVEMSRHRLLELGLLVLSHYHVDPRRVTLCIGDFNRLSLADSSLDWVFMSQAFHHADDSGALLREVRRVLKREGFVIMIGESPPRPFTASLLLRYTAGVALSFLPRRVQQRLFGRQFRLGTPPWRKMRSSSDDARMGDHHYTLDEYRSIFKEAHYAAHEVVVPSSNTTHGFILTPLR